MSGGLHAKLGDWYEHDYVVLLWLKMLRGTIDRVQWEDSQGSTTESGIDVSYVTSDGVYIGAQCKKRDSTSWPRSDVAKLLARAASGLTSESMKQLQRFEFVTNQPLSNHCGLFKPDGPLQDNACDVEERVAAITACRGNDGPTDEQIQHIAQIATQRILRWDDLTSDIHLYASNAKNGKSQRLIDRLLSLRANVVRRSLTRAELLHHLDDIKESLPHLMSSDLGEADKLSEGFVERARDRRLNVSRNALEIAVPIDRPDAGEIVQRLTAEQGSSRLRIHGGQGFGKSDVMAEVVDRLRQRSELVLAVNVGAVRSKLLEGGLLDRLVPRTNHGSRLYLAIDQLDQALDAHTEKESLLDAATEAMAIAHDGDCTTILGVRTVDTQRGSDLESVFQAAKRGATDRDHAVERLSPELVSRALEHVGVASVDLDADLREMLRTPFALKIFIDVAEATEAIPSRTTRADLLGEWIDRHARDKPSKHQAFNAYVKAYSKVAALGVAPSALREHRAGVDALIAAQVLETREDDRLHPTFQAVLDYELAVSIRDRGSAAAIVEFLGATQRQTLHHARLLRLAAPLLATGGSETVDAIGDLLQHDGLRLSLKRGLLLGLAELEEAPPTGLRNVIARLLEDANLRPQLLDGLVRRSTTWLRALKDPLRECWPHVEHDEQRLLLATLANAAVREGDVVAELLRAWNQVDESVIGFAGRVLPFDPSEDSAELFEMRLELPKELSPSDGHVDYARFFRVHPDRAARFLRHELERTHAADLVEHSSRWARALALPGNLVVNRDVAHTIWSHLRSWWSQLQVADLRTVDRPRSSLPGSPLAAIVEVLAEASACMLDHEQGSWQEFLETNAPTESRSIDLWLAMQTILQLARHNGRAYAEAVRWMMNTPDALQLTFTGGHRPADAVCRGAIRDAISEDLTAQILAWGAREELDLSQPKPRDIGAEFEREFERALTEAAASRLDWNDAEWEAGIADHFATPLAERRQTTGSYSFERMALQRIRQSPRERRQHVRSLLDRCPALPSTFTERAVAELLDPSPAPGQPRDPNTQITDEEAAAFLAESKALLGSDDAQGLASIVRSRPAAPWQSSLLRRLTAAAHKGEPGPVPMPARDRFTLEMSMLNEGAASCISSLARVAATRHEETQPFHADWMQLAEKQVASTNAATRIPAAELAIAVRGHGWQAHVLTAAHDPVAACDRSIAEWLLHWIHERTEQALCAEERLRAAIDTLESPYSSDVVSIVLSLVEVGSMDVKEAIRRSSAMPRGLHELTSMLSGRIASVVENDWERDLVTELALAPDRLESTECMAMLLEHSGASIVRDEALVASLLASPARSRHLDLIVKIFAGEAQVTRVAPFVLEGARRVANDSPPEDIESSYRLSEDVGTAIRLLRQLSEQAERESDSETTAKALDMLDELLLAKPGYAGAPLIASFEQ